MRSCLLSGPSNRSQQGLPRRKGRLFSLSLFRPHTKYDKTSVEVPHSLGDSRNNLESRALHRQCPPRTSYSLGVLTRSATADFPSVHSDEARPGLPASVDGHITTFVTASSTPASTPVEVCCLSCSRTPFACLHRWTLLSHITRRKTTSVASANLSRRRQASVTSTSLSTSLCTSGGELFLLCSLLSTITRTGRPLLFLLRVFFNLLRTIHRIGGFYQLVTMTTSCRVLLKTEEGDRICNNEDIRRTGL